jgi:hypothetical protein
MVKQILETIIWSNIQPRPPATTPTASLPRNSLQGSSVFAFKQLGKAWGARRLRGFVEIQIGNHHVALKQ